jgi:predicted DNA-binding protein
MARLTVRFEKKAADRLEKLADQTGRQKNDVLREALALEEVYQKYSAEGGTFFVRTKDGAEHEIIRA